MKKKDRKYSFLAFLMLLFIVGVLSITEQAITISLLGSLFFSLACSAVLLFCLMKLNVMEFQENSFWHNVNQRVNQPIEKGFINNEYVLQAKFYIISLQQSENNSSTYRKTA